MRVARERKSLRNTLEITFKEETMKIFFARTFAITLVLILSATGLWAAGSEEEPAAAADKKYVTDPTTGKEVPAPEYGGTLTWAATAYPENADHWWVSGWAHHFVGGVTERLAFADWGLSRDIWNGRDYAIVSQR